MAAAEARVKTCERELQTGKEALESLRVTLATMNDKDKALEKNFKKEFPGLNYNQLEALMKSYRYGVGNRCVRHAKGVDAVRLAT